MWATDSSRLPVVLDIVGGHDGMIHWVENDGIHIHRDRITGQDLWVVSYHDINTLPLVASSLDSRRISAETCAISEDLRWLWDLVTNRTYTTSHKPNILKLKLIFIFECKCDKVKVTTHSALLASLTVQTTMCILQISSCELTDLVQIFSLIL